MTLIVSLNLTNAKYLSAMYRRPLVARYSSIAADQQNLISGRLLRTSGKNFLRFHKYALTFKSVPFITKSYQETVEVSLNDYITYTSCLGRRRPDRRRFSRP